MSTTPIKVGDEVQWMETTKYANGSISFSTRYGKVTELGPTYAQVKRRGGKTKEIAVRRLVPINQPSPVNHVFGAITANV
jgi:hypothetical protein